MKFKLLNILFFFTYLSFAQSINVTEIELNYRGNSNPKNITKGITKIYFSADDGVNGRELWVSDNLTNSTYLVKDIIPGSNSGIDESIFITIGDILYFTPNSYTFGTELWRSDGTESGTYLVKDIGNTSFNTIRNLTIFNGNLYFSADDTINGNELWSSDGTESGTSILKDIYIGNVGSNPSDFILFNGNLFFSSVTAANGRELWKSDGTTSGTSLLKDINSTSNSSLLGGKFIILNNAFYFYADNGINGFELWKSDGTVNGTQLFKDIAVGNLSSNQYLIGAAANNYFIFEVNSSSIGTELWKCDGTVGGTVLLKDIFTGTNSSVSNFTQFALLNDKIYFDAYTPTYGLELWATDGTTIGTQLIKDISTGTSDSYITKLTSTNSFLIFSAKGDNHSYNTLWKSDGTLANTFELKDTDLSQNSNTDLSFVEFNNKVFFPSGYDSLNGIELWITDGTTTNTNIFSDIFHLYSGMTDFYDSAQLGNQLIFTGNNGNGNEPFITDGSIGGTRMIKDIIPGNGSPFFTSSDFRSASYTKAGNYVFFRAFSPGFGYEIWKTDGTEANTSMIKDIKVGTGNSISEFTLFTEYNGIFYFKADDGIHGEELWRSDGSVAGTYMLKDINSGSGYAFDGQSNIFYNNNNILNEKCFAILNGYLYFSAFDGTDSSIWRTDGTESGTIKVIIIPSSGVYDNKRVIINSNNNKIFFKTNTTNSSYGNNSLWSSDGNQSGTTFLYSTGITGPTQFKKNIIHNNNLYFSVYGNNGNTLMKSDGTLIGTIALIENFTTQETFNSLTSCGNYVYFGVGQQAISNKELWRTDGTTIGTVKLGEYENSATEYFINCNTCYQENLIFKKNSIDDDKIYYVNGSSTNADNYLTTNIVNSQNFGVLGYFIYTDFFSFNNKLLFTAAKQYGGYELYSSEFDITLDNPEFEYLSNNNIVIFPNPAKNIFNIKLINNEEIIDFKIYNLQGKEIIITQNSEFEFDTSNLASGIYLIKIHTNKTNYTKKLVIKK